MAQPGKESVCNAGDMGLIPGVERSPGEENGNSLQYSCLKNPMDREDLWATVHGVAESENLPTKQQHPRSRVICYHQATEIFLSFLL